MYSQHQVLIRRKLTKLLSHVIIFQSNHWNINFHVIFGFVFVDIFDKKNWTNKRAQSIKKNREIDEGWIWCHWEYCFSYDKTVVICWYRILSINLDGYFPVIFSLLKLFIQFVVVLFLSEREKQVYWRYQHSTTSRINDLSFIFSFQISLVFEYNFICLHM